MDDRKNLSQDQAYEIGMTPALRTEPVSLGPVTSYTLIQTPRNLCFILSRYKFCAKMLEGMDRVLEVGCGDAFGVPITAQTIRHLVAVDRDASYAEGNRQRLKHLANVEFRGLDLCQEAPGEQFDAAYSLDVIEHIDPANDALFMGNIHRSLKEDGVCIIGTPNVNGDHFSAYNGRIQHINLKSHQQLRDLMAAYFRNVFMFSMNDEVVHTGFREMAHYLLAVGVGKKPR